MARHDLIALCAGAFMFTGGFGFVWFTTPESVDIKLARIRADLPFSIPVRTLPPDVKALRCMMMWIGGPGGDPEMWCPAAPPLLENEDQAPPAIPTS